MAKRELVTRDAEGWICEYRGLPVVRVKDLRKTPKGVEHPIINLKGTNGSGKSTIPHEMIAREESPMLLTLAKDDKLPIATFCPTFNTILLGLYHNPTGGCDGLIPSFVQVLIQKLWLRDFTIIFEGVIVSDIRSTYYELMKECRELFPRKVHFCFMGTKLDECLARIQKRNGGKEIKVDLVRQKYKNSVRCLKYYLEQGDVECWVLPTNGSRTRVFETFQGHYQVYPNV